MQQTKKIEFWVGILMLSAMAAILAVALQITHTKLIGSGPTYTLTADFENIGGLKVKSPVKVGGVTVGEVVKIDLTADTFTPRVTLSLGEQYGHFPDTSSASILTAGLLGEQYIGITPGFSMEDTEILGNGDRIDDTNSAIVLENLIGQFLYKDKDK